MELAAQTLRHAPQLARRAASQAVPLLEAAVRDHPDDLHARESLGYALGMLDRLADARRVYEEVLRVEPHRETSLPYLGRTLAALGQPDRADAALREVIAVNPWRSGYRLALARYRSLAGDWAEAASASREAIRLNPELFEARPLLVQCLVRSGAAEEADAEFRTLLLFVPDRRDEWRRWYDGQKREPKPVGTAGAGSVPD
jgi:tetratricopeptide (TPR) repeat protein